MSEGRVRKSRAKVFWTPIISFAVLGALILGAVVFGNLVVDRADGCRQVGSDSQADSPDDATTLLVYSDQHDALMLCDVPQETVEYDPPQRSDSGIQIGDDLYRFASYDDLDESFGVIEGNDLFRDASNFTYSLENNRTPVYVKGEFGSIEDCGILGDSSYESSDFDGFDGSDMFHPDRIQSCWVEYEILYENLTINGG
ncbi:MAG: hypothetical protein OXC83_09155 [Chloroflexi bacterium]|nr:hypothetical protein [Chloroflexota bacterium]